MNRLPTCLLAATLFLGSASLYAEDPACARVRLADPGWSDIAVTNATAAFLLESLGYQVKIDTLSVPIIYGGLRDGQVDAFLGGWMPAHQDYHDKFVASGQVERLARNLDGTRFTWRCRATSGTPAYTASKTSPRKGNASTASCTGSAPARRPISRSRR